MAETASKPIGNRGRGRPKGVPNRVTVEIKTACQAAAPQMLDELKRLALRSENEGTRVAAIKEIFDRAYGKASQPLGQDPELPQLGVVMIPGKSE